MIATTVPKSTRTAQPHAFTTPVVQEMPRPVEPAWYRSTW